MSREVFKAVNFQLEIIGCCFYKVFVLDLLSCQKYFLKNSPDLLHLFNDNLSFRRDAHNHRGKAQRLVGI